MYDYIAKRYGIRPKYGERIEALGCGIRGHVRRERKHHAQYVFVLYDGGSHAVPEHPWSILYLDRDNPFPFNTEPEMECE